MLTKLRRLQFLGLLLGSMSVLQAQSVGAAAGLLEVRYALYKNKSADVEVDLRALSARGDTLSMQLLADVLSGSANSEKVRESVHWYKAAFAEGRGEISALTSLVRIVAKNVLLKKEEEDFFHDSLRRFTPTRDFESVTAALEIFLVYPQPFLPEQLRELISLHERACMEDCHGLLFRAKLIEFTGNAAVAESLFQKAVTQDARAVGFYYDFLGEEQNERFAAYAKTLLPQLNDLPAQVVQAIATLLASTAEKHDGDIVLWLDKAIATGSTAAMIAKADYMMAFAQDFGYEETFQLIDRVEAVAPLDGRSLRASAYMVRGWRSLNPHAAYRLLQGLIDDGYLNAYLGLGALYSMGGLDEVDQAAAIKAYRVLAKKGNAAAFYRIATIYDTGKGICNDKLRAYAFGKIASENGQPNARKLLNTLEETLSPADIERALVMKSDVLKELKLSL